ncbi:TetR/AcrR family transcriptional regulator, partial [Geobacter anodireducens]
MGVVKGGKPFDSCNATHERILETALGLFSTRGYLGATTREIARQAGIAEVTLFRHFPSKVKLLEEAITRYSM